MRLSLLAFSLFFSAAAAQAQAGPERALDFLAGDWTITDPSGATGRSHIVVQVPHAMLYELREIGSDGPLPLWFAFSEEGGWVQLFPGPAGMRAFRLVSDSRAWPLVFGGDVRLRDGTPVRFRLTMSRASNDESRRLLEMSHDGGATWSTAFDYTYRRAGH